MTLFSLPPSFRRRRGLRWLLAAAVVTAGLAAAADFVAGTIIRHRIAVAASRRLHAPVDVSLGGAPSLLDAVTGRIPEIRLTADDASVCQLGEVDVAVGMHDLRRHGSTVSVTASTATLGISPRQLDAIVGRRLPSATVALHPNRGSIELDAGPAGLVAVTLRPTLHGDTIGLRVSGASVGGRPIPATLLRGLQQRVHFSRTLAHLPLAMTPTGFGVVGDRLDVKLAGGAWQGRTRSSHRRACSADRAA